MLLFCTLLGCSAEGPTDEEQVEATTTEKTIPPVNTIPSVSLATAIAGRLPLRRKANGLLRARREITVKSLTSGLLTAAPDEGKYYRKGDLLVATDVSAQQLVVAAREVARDEAAFRHQDLLVQMEAVVTGDSLSKTQLKNLLIRSGLPAAESALSEATFLVDQSQLNAPFNGVAADVKVQAAQSINAGDEICTLTDLNSLEAEFSLLEQEIAAIGQKTSVYLSPVAQPNLQIPATLDIINPRVDPGGLLRVRAKLRAIPKGSRLYPGMNVLITLEGRSLPLILVPKEAVVMRTGRAVVFVYDSSSKRAQWKYVTISQENDEQVGISEGLSAGDQVIVSGNLTLDHDSEVAIEQKRNH